jgi:hypothetical protein
MCIAGRRGRRPYNVCNMFSDLLNELKLVYCAFFKAIKPEVYMCTSRILLVEEKCARC